MIDLETPKDQLIIVKLLSLITILINGFSGGSFANTYLGYDLLFLYIGYISSKEIKLIYSNFIELIKEYFLRIIFFVIISSIVICFFSYNPIISLRTGQSTLIGISNLYLLSKFNLDFPKIIKLNPFGHTWAISLCIQFLILTPIIFILKNKLSKRNFFMIFSTISLISFVFYLYFYINNNFASDYIIISKFWIFGIGFIVNILSLKTHIFESQRNLKTLIYLLFSANLIFISNNFKLITLVMIILISALFLCTNNHDDIYKITQKPIIKFLNNNFASIIIWHYAIIAISYWTIGIHYWSIPFQLVLIFTICKFEKIIIHKILDVIKSLNIGNTFIVTAGLFLVLALFINQNRKLLFLGSLSEDMGYPYTFKNEYIETTHKGKYCGIQIGKEIDLENCTLGDLKKSKRRIVAIGNSNLFSFIQAFDRFIEKNYAVSIFPAAGMNVTPNISIETNSEEYEKYYWEKVVPELIDGMNNNDVLFLVSEMVDQINSDYRPAKWQINYNQFIPANNNNPKKNLKIFRNDLIKLIDKVSIKGAKLAVMRPIPNPTDCYGFRKEWFNKLNNNKSCRFKSKEQIKNDSFLINKVLTELEIDYPNKFKAIDIFDVFCPGSICSYYDKNENLLYVDGQHPSNFSARQSQDQLFEDLKDF